MSFTSNKYLLIPLEIVEFVYDNSLLKPFAIFLYLKIVVGGKVSLSHPVFSSLKRDLKMADPKGRTFKKHFQKLLELNWIGFNPQSEVFHIRSFDYVRGTLGLKGRQASPLFFRDILQLQLYCASMLIISRIRKQQYYFERANGKSRAGTHEGLVPNQSKTSRRSSQLPYYGLCNREIAKLLGCKPTRACVLKRAAEKAGYLKVKHHFAIIKELTKPDYFLRATIAESKPEIAGRMRIRSKKKGQEKVIELVQQLHDEIIPLTCFKRVSRFKDLKVPFGIIKPHLKNNRRLQYRMVS